MSDSDFLSAFGVADILGFTDEGGWAFEKLPVDDVREFGPGAVAETAADLLPPAEREARELAWGDAGVLEALREAEARTNEQLRALALQGIGPAPGEEAEASVDDAAVEGDTDGGSEEEG